MESNEVLDKLPRHLMSLVIDQPYNDYTAQDHAIWRYVMHRNVKYLPQVAHGSYLDGLKKTGVSIEKIPHMYGMNRILKEIGWAAVAVDGFIPPSAFMEFQAYNVLVIAADMRPIDQIEYTPAPDIIHEAAGHAPIIANEEYAEYLRQFGWLGARAFSSAKDYELYEAIRYLSILKANPYTQPAEITAAEQNLAGLEASMGEPSEMALIRNLHWWTVEYGLIGDLNKPKIYGAGLLSSIGESFNCLKAHVKKLPYTIDAVNYSFDITNQQPHLFVTPDFENLNTVLGQFANTMALRVGGKHAVEKAIASGNTATCVYSSGLQVSGTFSEAIYKGGSPIYVRTEGPTALNFNGSILPVHSKDYHQDGFGSPVGKLKNSSKPIETMSDGDLLAIGIEKDTFCELSYESGVKLSGKLQKILRKRGSILLMSFSDCKVVYEDQTLFEPSWGMYDMAVGERIVSAFSGPADPDTFGLSFEVPKVKTMKIHHSPEAVQLHDLYQEVRDIREGSWSHSDLRNIFEQLKINYPHDWLLPVEIAELLKLTGSDPKLEKEIRMYLNMFAYQSADHRELVLSEPGS
ncbi:MAG: aromatic amino acid hydroxylase [Bacteroidales bacterium]|nr:aromatic amino acid hydroxylase [Bacteroidales bacterium]